MSTIASPRPSIALSSRRTSTSTDRSTSTTRNPGPATGSLRRNRAALRDYYGLQTSAASKQKTEYPVPNLDAETESELDNPDFDPESYVKGVLSREGLEGVMRIEASLVSEIRNLDGEKKALVYDNYSKLIAATETIRKMRTSMDPLTPVTGELEPRVGQIAENAYLLSGSLRQQHQGTSKEARKRQKQQSTVRWALDAPARIRVMVSQGKREEAESEWKTVESLLEKWQTVKGVDAVRQGCLEALDSGET